MDEDTLLQFDDIDKNFRDIIYSIKCPEHSFWIWTVLYMAPTWLFLCHPLKTEFFTHGYKATKEDKISYAVTYGEFLYQAGSWDYPRRVVFKIEKPYGQLMHMYTFIVTNMDMEPYQVI